MQIFLPLEKLDREQRLVYGYATTEARDSQGEVVTRAAIEAALPAYMQFANIREMHQLSAVGVVKSADLDDKGLRLSAKVVDDDAWAKVKEGVYKGLSIGGRVTQRDALNKSLITGVDLTEISLVDRPANPEALIDAYKAAGGAVGKVGARNSEADLARIQSMHDTAVALGASCPGHAAVGDDAGDQASDGADAGNDAVDDGAAGEEMLAVAGGRGDLLAKLDRLGTRIAALSKRVEKQAGLLQKIADEPAPPKYLTARGIEKAADGAAASAEDAIKTPLDAIKKSHRNPIRLSLG
ncbi:MAG TPA: XkdF-like putative serine protease domain-containing protein [Stellaceae bacterium]|nr:XkdF-like putative serine protease domain-containing protein [Stellaceae bacterium]